MIGQSGKDLAPQFVQQYGAMVRRVIETGEPVYNVEVRGSVRTRQGEIAYWLSAIKRLSRPVLFVSSVSGTSSTWMDEKASRACADAQRAGRYHRARLFVRPHSSDRKNCDA